MIEVKDIHKSLTVSVKATDVIIPAESKGHWLKALIGSY